MALMRARLSAVRQAAAAIRPALTEFYEARIGQGQKVPVCGGPLTLGCERVAAKPHQKEKPEPHPSNQSTFGSTRPPAPKRTSARHPNKPHRVRRLGRASQARNLRYPLSGVTQQDERGGSSCRSVQSTFLWRAWMSMPTRRRSSTRSMIPSTSPIFSRYPVYTR